MENKNYEYIRKPKLSERIDPLLAREYEKLAADKARSLINRPDHEVSELPIHDLVPVSAPDINQNRIKSGFGVNEISDFHRMTGTTEEFIGDGDHAVIQSSDFDDIKDLEKKAIDEAESKDYINGLPEGKLVEPIDLNKFREQLRLRKNDNNGNTDGPGAA